VNDKKTIADSPTNNQEEVSPASMSVIQQLWEEAKSRRAAAANLRANGPSTEADALEAGAQKLDDAGLDIVKQCEINRTAALNEKWLKDYSHYKDWHLENNRSIISMSQSAVRLIATANAGAAVALLAFLGNALAKSENIVASRFACSLLIFAIGVVAAALVAASSYLTQLLYGVEDNAKIQTWAKRLHGFTIVLWFGALLIFAGGCFETYNAVRSSVQNQGVEMQLNKSSTPINQDLKRNNPPPARASAAPPVVDQPIPKVPVAPQDKP
jgi:hypothetical protein